MKRSHAVRRSIAVACVLFLAVSLSLASPEFWQQAPQPTPSIPEHRGGDAATWLPASRAFRCQYVARQIAVKQKYRLWVTQAEKEAMMKVLNTCPGQQLPQE